jgi:DNA polymerase
MVQTLVTTRLGVKSTLEETRTERFIDIAKRGLLPVPIRYYAAHTGRWGGDDKINIQNLPSRGENGKVLKKCIVPPDGYTLIDCDSSQIEARVLAWVAEQKDLVKAFTNKEDVYVKMASSIYGVPESEVTKEQRFVGKTTILGCGYGMGSYRFQDQLATFGVDISIEESRRIVKVYRETNDKIVDLWQKAQNMLVDLVNKDKGRYGTNGIIKYKDNGILLPSGIMMQYEDIKSKQEERGLQFDYKSRRGRTKIYGGKVIENVCQAFARCIIAEQMLKINKKHRVVLTVHDSLVCCVLDDEVTEAKHFIEECMRETPEWAEGLPLDCEAFTGKSYGDCEE